MPGLVLDHCSFGLRRTTSQSTGNCFCWRIGLGVSPIYQATSFGVGEGALTPRSYEDKKLARRIYGYQGAKLLDDHAFLSETFREHTRLGAVAGRKQYAMQQMPRLLLETLAILGLALLTLASVYIGEDRTLSLPKLGMIAFGLVRLMPSVARIVHSCQSVVYGWPCVKVLKEEIGNWKLDRRDPESKAECSFDESFQLEDVFLCLFRKC